jgi:hypothetical protein
MNVSPARFAMRLRDPMSFTQLPKPSDKVLGLLQKESAIAFSFSG